MSQQSGDFLVEHFFNNVGGLNLSDSPFRVANEQATGGLNYEYALTGGFKKRFGHPKVNSVADTQLKTLGMSLYLTAAADRYPIRAAGRKLQYLNTAIPSFTNLSEDTVTVGTDFFALASTQQVVSSSFSSSSSSVLWHAGGGATSLYGVYSSTKVTANGVTTPAGTLPLSAGGTGGILTTGTYFYGVAFHKASTGATGNVSLDTSIAVTAGQKVTVTLSSITAFDATKYDQVWIYRSTVSGSTGFTTGDIIAKLAAATVSYVDDGSYISTAQNVPRAGNLLLDNSVLPAGAVSTITTWKRRLVTAIGSTVYLSDVNKSESWPAQNFITVPTGGPITSLSIISFTTAASQSVDEFLVIQKENELWIVTGSTFADWSLKYISNHGVLNQAQVVSANGYLAWLNYKGVYVWDGTGKPIRLSRPIQFLFDKDGDIDKSKLTYAWGAFFEKSQSVVWYLSSFAYGDNKYSIKLDLKLTSAALSASIGQREADGVFIQDKTNFALFGGGGMYLSSDDALLAGDDAGFVYNLFTGDNDANVGVDFSYETKYLDFGTPGVTKRIQKIIAWTEDSSDGRLRLDWWTAYRSTPSESSSADAVISKQVTEAIWDRAYWEVAYWDNTFRAYNPVVFNLSSQRAGGTEGDCIKLKFSNSTANVPVTIAGFSVIYSTLGLRK